MDLVRKEIEKMKKSWLVFLLVFAVVSLLLATSSAFGQETPSVGENTEEVVAPPPATQEDLERSSAEMRRLVGRLTDEIRRAKEEALQEQGEAKQEADERSARLEKQLETLQSELKEREDNEARRDARRDLILTRAATTIAVLLSIAALVVFLVFRKRVLRRDPVVVPTDESGVGDEGLVDPTISVLETIWSKTGESIIKTTTVMRDGTKHAAWAHRKDDGRWFAQIQGDTVEVTWANRRKRAEMLSAQVPGEAASK